MPLSMRTLLVWGMLSGLVAGILALGFAEAFGEPPVEVAIAFEQQQSAAQEQHAGHAQEPAAEPEPVSRGVQSTVGLGIATCLFGTALGGLFALAFAFAYGRIARLTPRSTALLLAGLGFGVVFLVPFLNYPANPPSVGRSDTISDRSATYFGMVAISIVLSVAAMYARRWLAGRIENWLAVVVAALGYIVAVWAIGALLPHFNEVPANFPAQTLWQFRVASLGTQVVLWASIGIAFAALLDRAARATNRTRVDELAAG